MSQRQWTGRAVSLRQTLAVLVTGKSLTMELTEDAGRKLALAIKKLQQSYVMHGPEVQEVVDALDYVLVGDPRSVNAHTAMENRKGMEPAGDAQGEQ